MYEQHVKDRAKCHSRFLQVHGISPYPLHDRCIGQNPSAQHVGNSSFIPVQACGLRVFHRRCSLELMLLFTRCSQPTGPSSPPASVGTSAISSTSILVSWTRVQPIDRNGEIIKYEVWYEPLEAFMGTLVTGFINTTNGSEFEVLLNNLEEYVSYNISVRAYTIVGAGPFSTGRVATTLQDGKTSWLSFFYC